MVNTAEMNGRLAIDANGLNNLKQAAKENSPEAIRDVAKQFEAIFMNMMLKSMREATTQDSPFDNEQSRTFTSMLDQQLSTSLSAKGLGLADILTKQLSKVSHAVTNTMEQAVSESAAKVSNGSLLESITSKNFQKTSSQNLQAASGKLSPPQTSHHDSRDFHARMSEHAAQASRVTGIPAHLMLGQAALESGWGKHEITSADGTSSRNLFGIKATADWKGKVVEATTTEYVHGIKQRRIEKFRAYDSYADSFKDFANMITNSPRYQQVMANLHDIHGYAHAMQKSGYATDPHYASKLAGVIQKVVTG